MAHEKRVKLTLNQEVEAIKDRFNELQKTMHRLELLDNLDKAASFLNEYTQLSYYSLLASLG